jgi:hypothetical protein
MKYALLLPLDAAQTEVTHRNAYNTITKLERLFKRPLWIYTIVVTVMSQKVRLIHVNKRLFIQCGVNKRLFIQCGDSICWNSVTLTQSGGMLRAESGRFRGGGGSASASFMSPLMVDCCSCCCCVRDIPIHDASLCSCTP